MEKKLNNFSPHLFWDTDRNKLDIEKHHKYIIKNVLLYGLINDWNSIVSLYGIKRIAETASSIKDMDKKTANFVAFMSNTSKENFACYTSTQSTQKHWNF
jgi:hypothetical protein